MASQEQVMTVLILIALINSNGTNPNNRSELPRDNSTGGLECGLDALILYSRLIGYPQDRALVRSSLGPVVPGRGYSMLQLQEAGRGLGIPLRGVRLNPEASNLQTPIIILCRLGEHFHYRVLRPIGHSGRVVQILDPSYETPFVLDYETVRRSAEWTGYALIPSSHSASWVITIITITIISLILVYIFGKLRKVRPDAERAEMRGRS
jgi:ABC-type bacteriocin/lantibiotic exporter with double-glycine peptidase domain